MAVIALVMTRSFIYEGSRPIVIFTFMLGLCIIMLDSFIRLGFIRCFLPRFVICFSPILEFSNHGCYVLGKRKIGCRVEAAAVKLVRMSLSVVLQDRQDIPLSHTSHLRLHRHNCLPPSKSCECLKKEGATICWKY